MRPTWGELVQQQRDRSPIRSVLGMKSVRVLPLPVVPMVGTCCLLSPAPVESELLSLKWEQSRGAEHRHDLCAALMKAVDDPIRSQDDLT